MNELQREELQELAALTSEEKERFRITDLDELNWAFRKLHAIKTAKRTNEQVRDSEINRIEEWFKRVSEPLEADEKHFEYLIQQYHEEQLAHNPNKKSISTPYGKVKSRVSNEQPEKVDENKLLEYVKANDLPFIATKETIKWADLKKTLSIAEVDGEKLVIDEYGQVVSGVNVKPKTVTFTVEVE